MNTDKRSSISIATFVYEKILAFYGTIRLVIMFRYNFYYMKATFYMAPAFMDKLVVHIAKKFRTLATIKVCSYAILPY